jgi:DNA-directed RNA polymerase specialized sigma24 family protein
MNASCPEKAESCFEEFHREHGEHILRYFLCRVPSTSAQDLARQTYVRMFQAEKESNIHWMRAYLYRAALNVLRDYWARQRLIERRRQR